MMDTSHYTFAQTHKCATPRVNPNVNCGLELIMMSQCWLIKCSKRATVTQNVNNRGN